MLNLASNLHRPFPPLRRWAVALLLIVAGQSSFSAQNPSSMPATAGERISGGTVVLAQATHGQAAILVASFSRESSAASQEWVQQLHTDPAFSSDVAYQLVMLERAPGFVRSLIRSSLRRQTPPAWQPNTLVYSQDNSLWRSWIGVSDDHEPQPWIVALNPAGKILWRGHGNYASSVQSLKAALR